MSSDDENMEDVPNLEQYENHTDVDQNYFDTDNNDNAKEEGLGLGVAIAVPIAEGKSEESLDDATAFSVKRWNPNRQQYENNPWEAGCNAFQAPPDDVASLGMQGIPTDLMLAIEEVSTKIPTVSWESAANAMKASLTLMVQEERSVDVVAFAKECMYQVLYVMVGLNSIEGKPKTMTDLQEMWKEKVFDKFNSCFHEGLACAMRVMLRIGGNCPANELKQWHDWHKEYNRYGAWINSVELLLDETQPAYLDRGEDHPNTIYHSVVSAFNDEGGFAVLNQVLDSTIFESLSADKQMDREQLFHCKIARLLKRISIRLRWAMEDLTEKGVGAKEGKAEQVEEVMTRVEELSKGAAEWLSQRLNTAPDKLSNRGKAMDVELLDVLADLMGPEASINLANGLLAVSSLGTQQAGLKLARQLRAQGGDMEVAFVDLPKDFLAKTVERFSGEGEELVKQLLGAQVVNKRSIVDTFDELDELMVTDTDKIAVCQVWGEIGLRCMCTDDERTREIGVGLLDSLQRRQFAQQAKLTEAAEAVLDWMQETCNHEGPALVKTLMATTLHEAERVVNLLTTLMQVLIATDSERVSEVPKLWVDVALSCLRCTDKYGIREMGFLMTQEAVRTTKQVSYPNISHSSSLIYKSRLGKELQVILNATVEEFLGSLFSEKTCHHAVIRLVSGWLVTDYYRDFCYEDDEVDLMKFLVDAAVHPDWGVVDAVTDLLVKITVSNISIKSLNSLCNLFGDAVSTKATAIAGNKLVLTWIDKTRQKKWVMSVQEKVLNLLWTMLVTKSSENEDDTLKVLDYFKNQFGNIRGHLSEWAFTGLSEKELTAKNCILTCAKDCLVELRGSVRKEPRFEDLTIEDQRSRATQSSSLLQIVLDLVDNLRPDLLREMHEGNPTGMLTDVYDELCYAGSNEVDDVDDAALFSRLSLLGALCSYLQPQSPLTAEWIAQIWNMCIEKHRGVVLKWYTIILDPSVGQDTVYFPDDSEGKAARSVVLENLSNLITEHGFNMADLGADGTDCLLQLFMWVNKDTGAFRDDPSANVMSEDQDIEVVGDDLIAFDTIAVAALDSPPELSKSSEYTLLTVSEAIYRARLMGMKRDTWNNEQKDPPSSFTDPTVGLGRYDLLESVFTRLQSPAAADEGKVNHWLSVLSLYLRRLSEFNSDPAHGCRAEGEEMVLNLMMGKEVAGIHKLPVHTHTMLKDALAKAVQLAEESGANLDVSAPAIVDIDEEPEGAGAAAEASVPGIGKKQILKPVQISKTGNPIFRDSLKGANQTLAELEVKHAQYISVQDDIFAGEMADEDLPSPSDVLSTNDGYINTLFKLLELPSTCEAAWKILQMVPTAKSAEEKLNDAAAEPSKFVELLGSSSNFWRRVYSCQTVESHLMPASADAQADDVANTEWRRKFVQHGGLGALFSLISEGDIGSLDSFVRSASLGPVVRVIKFCVCNSLMAEAEENDAAADDDASTGSGSPSRPTLNRQFSGHSAQLVKDAVDLTMVITALFAVIRVGAADELSEGEVSAVSNAIATITVIVQKTDKVTWQTMCQALPLDVLVRLILDSPEMALREQVSETFSEIINSGDYMLLDTADGQLKPAEDVLGNLFTAKLDSLPLLSPKAEQFFTLLRRLVDVGGTWFEPASFVGLLTSKLRQFTVPVTDSEADSVLVGLLKTFASCIKTNQSLCDSPGSQELVKLLTSTFLLRLPAAASKQPFGTFPAPSVLTGPVCFTDESRSSVCRLLYNLTAVENAANCGVLTQLLFDFASQTDLPHDEQILCRASEDIKSFARPGLHNNANRCYMNSLMQQFASLKAFREQILKVPVRELEVSEEEEGKEEEKEEVVEGGTWDCSVCTLQNDVENTECNVCGAQKPENAKITAAGVDPKEAQKAREKEARAKKAILREFQRTLRFLSGGEMTFYDAEPLLKTVGSNLALMYPAEQQNDTKEFMDKLLEHLEVELSGTTNPDLVSTTFGATIAKVKTRQHDKKHISRNPEYQSTYTMTLIVEGHDSVESALKANFEPDIHEVDDEEDTDEAGKPVKYKFEYRTLFAELPSVLCIQLNRFSYDYGRGVPIKHNHRIEIPEVLDMQQYSEVGRGAVYKLKGMLIHMGATASSGHYYSIIKSRPADGEDPDSGAWLKFDDNRVSELKADEIDEECFGGEYVGQQKDTYGNLRHVTREKGWNAYLVFYELDSATAPPPLTKEEREASKGEGGEPEKKDGEEEGEDDDEEEAPIGPDEAVAVLEAQAEQVQTANEKLWRRALLYQPATLDLFRKLIAVKLFAAKKAIGPVLMTPELARSLVRTGFALYERAVLHCEDVAASESDLRAWTTVLVSLFSNDPQSALAFLEAISAATKGEEGEATAAAVAAAGPNGWEPSELIRRAVLQKGAMRNVTEVRDSAITLITGVAKGLAEVNMINEGPGFSQMVKRLLDAVEVVVQDADVLDGYMCLFLELAKSPALRPKLLSCDVAAYLAHIYLANLSPAPEYTGDDAAAIASGEPLPKLPANTRKSIAAMYSHPLHNYKILLQALSAVLRSATPTEVFAAMPPLSRRLLNEARLLTRLVDKDPLAGLKTIVPEPPTPEEEEAMLLAEGWQKHAAQTGKIFWSHKRRKDTSTWERPKPRKHTVNELEDLSLKAAAPSDLLLVSLALMDPSMAGSVCDALVQGVERSYPNSRVLEHKLTVLKLLLQCDGDEHHEGRVQRVAEQLNAQIGKLREGEAIEVRALKNHQKCSRMEVLVKAVQELQDTIPAFVLIFPKGTLDWFLPWIEEFKPAMRVTLDDLQGKWTNSQHQDITIEGDQCTFADGNPVQISPYDTATYSTYSVPGWVLSQDHSHPNTVNWVNQANGKERTVWMRPSPSTTDDLDVTGAQQYGPQPKNPNFQVL